MYSNTKVPPVQFEKISTKELEILDKESITSVVDFVRKFQDDATFSPPSVEVLYDSDKYAIDTDTDDEVLNLFGGEIEDFDEVMENDDATTKRRDDKKK